MIGGLTPPPPQVGYHVLLDQVTLLAEVNFCQRFN